MPKHGLFVGLITLDFIYLAANTPNPNQKIVADDYTVAAGGPATNAGVTFAQMGDRATLLGVLGKHDITHLIRADLDHHRVNIVDLAPSKSDPPPVSSIIVTKATGERAVISINATKCQISDQDIPPDILDNVDIVMIDGHQMQIGIAIAKLAQTHQIPVVVDGGTWKPGFEQLFTHVDYALCSAHFYPPNCHSPADTFNYLANFNIPYIGITQGENPMQYLSNNQIKSLEVSPINAVDTLGAGDIFHGAFCHYILHQNFLEALDSSAKIASHSCKFFGTRSWLNQPL